jgi:hypothetical protein
MGYGKAWTVGVTTVPSRVETHLPKTLLSLCAAGFPQVRLFVDGADNQQLYKHFGQDVTYRWPMVGAFGNWILALGELYIRDPASRFYALFQDDIVACKGLRQYVQATAPGGRCYLNLYTSVDNYRKLLTLPSGRPAPEVPRGWVPSNQRGRGALGLVFTREAIVSLFTASDIAERPMDAIKATRNIDGAVITTLTKAGYTEYIHNPSLLQHRGEVSVIHDPGRNKGPRESPCFVGEGVDVRNEMGVAASS